MMLNDWETAQRRQKHQGYFPSCISPRFLFSSIPNIYKCTSTVGAAVFSLSGGNAVKFTASSNSKQQFLLPATS